MRLIQIAGLIFTLARGFALFQARTMREVPGLTGLALYALSLGLFWSCIRANRQKPLTLAFNSDQAGLTPSSNRVSPTKTDFSN